ncbi:MAG: UDP-N-acetylmuramate dehydrogenase [bacterium]
MPIEQKIQEDVDLKPMTTFKIGGRAKLFIDVAEKNELEEAMEWARKNKIDYFILAGGSNVLINSDGVDGLVIKLNNKEIKVLGERMECGAGAEFGKAVNTATSTALSGLEWAVGIPGAVGGAIRGNAGAYGGSISDSVETIEVYDLAKKRFVIFSKNDCQFGYRDSIIKQNKKLIIWQATLRLSKMDGRKVIEKASENLMARQSSQPKLPSAGCIFKNPEIAVIKEASQYLAKEAEKNGVVRNGKVGAGWIIKELGFGGKKQGGAKVSLEHTNFIVNTGNATAGDVAILISFIKQRARTMFNLELHEEIEYLGF